MCLLVSILLVSIYIIEENYGDNKNISLDILGTLFFTIFISSLTYTLIKGNDYGWTSYTILILLVFSIVFLIMFLIRQLKAHNAMLPMKIFKNRQFSLGNITILLIGIILNSILFIFSLYLTKLVQKLEQQLEERQLKYTFDTATNNNGQNNNVEEKEFTEESQNINQEQEGNRPKNRD